MPGKCFIYAHKNDVKCTKRFQTELEYKTRHWKNCIKINTVKHIQRIYFTKHNIDFAKNNLMS